MVLAAVAVLLAGAGVFLVARGWAGEPPHGAPMPEQTFSLAPEAVPDPGGSAEPAGNANVGGDAGAARQQVPAGPVPDGHLVIPAIGVDARTVAGGIGAGGLLDLPADVDEVTLWSGSAPIGAPDGGILVAGHVDNVAQGAGALFAVHTLEPGDAVYLAEDGVVTRWKVTALQAFVKEQLPQWVFQGDDGPRRLHIVTCGGEIVHDALGRGSYRDNVVATAVPF